MLLNWTQTGKTDFRHFFRFSFSFWQVPFFDKHSIARLSIESKTVCSTWFIHWTGNHLIRVFAFSELHFFVPRILYQENLSRSDWSCCLFVEVSHISSFPIMLFDDRKYLKCDLTRWQNENVCFTMDWVGAPVGMTHPVHFSLKRLNIQCGSL